MEIDLVDGPSVTRQLVEDPSRRRVPDVNESVAGSRGHLATVRTPRHSQQILDYTADQPHLISTLMNYDY